MYTSRQQLIESLRNLKELHPFFGISFLAFKLQELPRGSTKRLNFSRCTKELLDRYYKPTNATPSYYIPFLTSDPSNRWRASRYPSTSLQRITADTFAAALIHPKNTQEWGWDEDYIAKLSQHLGPSSIPAFDLAVWLFRSQELPPNSTSKSLCKKLFDEFKIEQEEVERLFSLPRPAKSSQLRTQPNPLSESELLDIIGWPSEVQPARGNSLFQLRLRGIGPAKNLQYDPSERLNVITGDNSLGKTFLLDCIWWALTGYWSDRPGLPRADANKTDPKIDFQLQRSGTTRSHLTGNYSWENSSWNHSGEVKDLPGLVVYARYNGSFAIFDPSRPSISSAQATSAPQQILFTRNDVWNGLAYSEPERKGAWICNGLIRDWVSWQRGGARFAPQLSSLNQALEILAPAPGEALELAEPIRLPSDSREIPSLHHGYGDVPILLCSAGIQRIVALAYLLVWAWFEHLENSRQTRRDPQETFIFIIDEVEAHLHPRWQRVIAPALLRVLETLDVRLRPQIHMATHSPLVLAGLETIADLETDSVHHLLIDQDKVAIERIELIRRGRIDRWLISPAFGLVHARSLAAERSLEKAIELQGQDDPDPKSVETIHSELVKLLAPDDDFWPRWIFFARSAGLDL